MAVGVVTGASSGSGAEMARQFAARGWDLALCARRTDRLDALAGEIRSVTGRRVETAALDVTDPDAVPAVFAPTPTRETAMTDFVGALAQCESALEVFRRQQRGHLVPISSMSALRGMRRSMTVYAATKAGVRAMVAAIEARKAKAYVPTRPWVPIGVAMRVLPLSVVRRLS